MATSGVRGLIHVGAVDSRGAGDGDDVVASFSGAGRVDVSAPGVGVPVEEPGPDGVAGLARGTSVSTPIAVETAAAMSAANPRLSVDEIERLLKDPRVARDIPGTKRDGAGTIDQFAAVVLAANPNLSREQLEQARARLAGRLGEREIEALRRELGLEARPASAF